MRKLIIVLVMMIFLLGGCQKKTDAQRFSSEFEVSQNNTAHYLSNFDDLLYQLQHGIHVVLMGKGDKDINPLIKILVEEVNKYPGMVIYYYDQVDIKDNLTQKITELIAFTDYEIKNPVLYMVKEGEVIDVLNTWDSGKLKELLDSMAKDVKPGCDDC